MSNQNYAIMEIKKTNWGEIVTIPETEINSEFTYHLRSVRRINNNNPYEQELINELEPKEKKARRKFLILAKSMEYFFKTIPEIRGCICIFDEWERKNKMNWNDWFHGQLHELEEEVNSYSFEYASRSEHGWCL
jgi:hypothetical protein